MAIIKKYISKYKYQLFCLMVSFSILLFTSKNSFLYTFNDWCDANAFFTVGKSIIHGLVPYKDLFEQKGPLLYFIYSFGYLISQKTFYGIFILEILFYSIYLYYNHKIIKFFLEEKYSFIILPILTLIITTSPSFVQGGSCEEFCLPFFSISLYYFLKHFIMNELTKKEIIGNGIIAGVILLTKYTLLGFWVGFVLLIFIDLIQKKEGKNKILFIIDFLLGFMIPIIVVIIYFYMVGGLSDFIWNYFIINITAYGPSKITLHNILFTCWYLLCNSGLLFYLGIILTPALIFSIKNINKNLKINVLSLFLITLFFITVSLKTYIYYILPISIFLPISIIGFIFLINKNTCQIKKYIYIIIYIICIIIGANNANYKEDILKPKEEIFQYKYANYINKFKKPTLLNMGYLDVGVYTLSNIIPSTKYFEQQNISYERFKDNIDELNKYATNKKIKFIVYCTDIDNKTIPKSITNNYNLVYEDKYIYEKQKLYARLYQLKELSLK